MCQACGGGTRAVSSGPGAPNPLPGTCWPRTQNQTFTIDGGPATFTVVSRWVFRTDAAWAFTRGIPDQLLIDIAGGYWPEQLSERHWPYTAEWYAARSFNLTTEEWTDITLVVA